MRCKVRYAWIVDYIRTSTLGGTGHVDIDNEAFVSAYAEFCGPLVDVKRQLTRDLVTMANKGQLRRYIAPVHGGNKKWIWCYERQANSCTGKMFARTRQFHMGNASNIP